MQTKSNIHEKVHLFGLFLLAASLPLSKFTLSVSQLILVVNWLLSANFGSKWQTFKANKPAMFLVSIYLVHVLGLAITNIDWAYALNDLRIKLPLLALPIILATMPPINLKQFHTITWIFVLAVVTGTIFSFVAYLGYTSRSIDDARNFSMFISHIRFGILIAIALIFCLYFLSIYQKFRWLLATVFCAIWLLFSLIILESVTGFVMLFVALLFFSFYQLFTPQKKLLGSIGILTMLCLLAFFSGYAYQEVKYFLNQPDVKQLALKTHTPSGELYYNNTERLEIENGNYVWINVAFNELKNEWQKVSTLTFDGNDKKNQPLHSTLIRYMASKGLTKDSVGFVALNQNDIKAIENGETNHRFVNQRGFDERIYKISWEIDHYLKGGNPSGNSVIQRLEFWRVGSQIIKENPLFGVGTGDVRAAFDEAYIKTNSQLSEANRLKAHNQFFTFIISFGFVGFIMIVFALVMVFFYSSTNTNHKLFVIVFAMILASMISEDTLETQIGATIYAYFSSFLLFGYRNK